MEFSGTGRDPKDGIPTNFSLVWYSDINGVIGTPENAYRVNEIVSVKELIASLVREYELAAAEASEPMRA